MSTFEWSIVVLLVFGLVLPIWIFFISAFLSRKVRSGKEPSSRYFAYSELLEYIDKEIQKKGTGLGPLWVATIRELRKYPEYSDISLLYIDGIKITGSTSFDQTMKIEIEETKNYLIGNTK